MAEIKPFHGIRANPDYAGEVVLDIENLSLDEAKIIRQENPYSYVNMLVPKLDNLFLRGSKNELAFKKINENFEDFLENKILIRDEKPSFYIYRISEGGYHQTGLWTLSRVNDYLDGRIKKHELTRPDREKVLVNYMEQTGIDANPVLLTYRLLPTIEVILNRYLQVLPDLSFRKDGVTHNLWKIDESNALVEIKEAFESVPCGYIADGHHRAAAAALLAVQQRRLNPDYTGEEEYNFFTTVYMSMDQLRLYPFNRLVKDPSLMPPVFVDKLRRTFIVEMLGKESVMPGFPHQFGMYLKGCWYLLRVIPELVEADNPVETLDADILQNLVLSGMLNIQDPRTDSRIAFPAGTLPVTKLVEQVDSGEYDILFTLFPVPIEQIIRVADAGGFMPPKSTWFEPKFQAGLLIHKIF